MSRMFLALVVVDVLGVAWVLAPPQSSVASAQVDAPTEQVAVEVAWSTATDELDRRCGTEAHNVAGVEEIEQVSNGYRARVSLRGSCS